MHLAWSKQEQMKKLTIIALSLAMAGCTSQPTQNAKTEKTAEPARLNIGLINGEKYTSGQGIDIQYSVADGANADSAVAIIGKRKIAFDKGSNQMTIATDGMKVGQETIRIEAWLANGTRAEGKARITIKSDIVPERLTYKVIKKLPHNNRYYTQGLEFDGDLLYEGTGLEGHSSVYKIDFAKQSVINSIDLDNKYFGEGITIMGNKLYQLTWQSFTGFVYNKNTLNRLHEFSYASEGWGLTNDGKSLIMSDGSEKIHFIDTATLQETHYIEVYDNEGPVTQLNELEYVNGLIYANIYCTDNIVAIDPNSGKVMKIIDMRNLLDMSKLTQRVDVLNGIAYQKSTGNWYVTGKLWPAMFQVEFVAKI